MLLKMLTSVYKAEMLLKMLASVTIQLYIYVLKKIYIYCTCIYETFLISTFPFIFYQRKKYSICITIFCVISGAGTSYPSGALEFIPGFYWGSFYSIFSFMCMFCRSLFVLSYFSFGHCVVCSSLIYGFLLPLWYLQALLILM
jgi:hypothetical protein